MEAIVKSLPWKGASPPSKILVIRFQALGDTVITFPYLTDLKRQYPSIEIHFFTLKKCSPIPKSIELFDDVIAIGGGRNAKVQFILTLLYLPYLWLQGYDAVIDLQNHKISKILRKLLQPKAWAEFDRSSPISAGERTRQTIEALWIWKIKTDTNFCFKKPVNTSDLLHEFGKKPGHDLVVLNPAGYCSSRHWPIENYAAFAELWLKEINPLTQFVLLLLPAHRSKADFIKKILGDTCIDLTGHANQVEAFAILKESKLILSEDSGLMHMAWVQGIPTIALFSSSRKDWSAPLGEWSYCFDSSDLECGPCMQETCQYGDNRCLVRYTPELILKKAVTLYGKK